MALPGREALDVILESLTPARLIQSLAEEDFFWLLQDIGPEDALPILARASNDQWQYLLDIELWHKDRLSNNSVNQWLDLRAVDEVLITGLTIDVRQMAPGPDASGQQAVTATNLSTKPSG